MDLEGIITNQFKVLDDLKEGDNSRIRQIQILTAIACIKNFNLNVAKFDVGTMHERNSIDEIVEEFENQKKDLNSKIRLKDTQIQDFEEINKKQMSQLTAVHKEKREKIEKMQELEGQNEEQVQKIR